MRVGNKKDETQHSPPEPARAVASVIGGGAATLHEEVKNAKYASILAKGAKFVPFVMDSYGALVPLYAQRLGISATVASRVIFGCLSCCVIRHMAAIAAPG